MRYFTKPQLLMLVLAVAYIVMPADLIPELIFGPFGLVDDAAAFATIVSILVTAKNKARNETTTIDGETITAETHHRTTAQPAP